METSLKRFRDEYLDLLLRFLWREWTALGVAGQDQGALRHVIDPEALLLFTCSIGRYDQCLFDEALDWLAVNGRFLNVQRMKNILRKEPFSGGRVLVAVADWLSRRENPLKWKLLAQTSSAGHERESLFFLPGGRSLPNPSAKDPTFLTHGFVRNPVVLRGYSRPFPADAMPCHFLRMRALFGVNTRCDALVYLAMNRTGHPRAMARELYYSQKAIHDVMTDLGQSGAVHSARPGRERVFRITSSGLPLLTAETDVPRWVNWPILLSAADVVWKKVDELERSPLDPLIESSELTLTVKPLLERLLQASCAPALPVLANRQGASLLDLWRDAFLFLAA